MVFGLPFQSLHTAQKNDSAFMPALFRIHTALFPHSYRFVSAAIPLRFLYSTLWRLAHQASHVMSHNYAPMTFNPGFIMPKVSGHALGFKFRIRGKDHGLVKCWIHCLI